MYVSAFSQSLSAYSRAETIKWRRGSAFYAGATAATSETHRKLINGQRNPSCVDKTGRLHRIGRRGVTETAVSLRDRIFAVNYLSYCFIYFPIIQISALLIIVFTPVLLPVFIGAPTDIYNHTSVKYPSLDAAFWSRRAQNKAPGLNRLHPHAELSASFRNPVSPIIRV